MEHRYIFTRCAFCRQSSNLVQCSAVVTWRKEQHALYQRSVWSNTYSFHVAGEQLGFYGLNFPCPFLSRNNLPTGLPQFHLGHVHERLKLSGKCRRHFRCSSNGLPVRLAPARSIAFPSALGPAVINSPDSSPAIVCGSRPTPLPYCASSLIGSAFCSAYFANTSRAQKKTS